MNRRIRRVEGRERDRQDCPECHGVMRLIWGQWLSQHHGPSMHYFCGNCGFHQAPVELLKELGET